MQNKVPQTIQGHSLWAEPVRKRTRSRKTVSSRMFLHTCDTVVCELQLCPHTGTQACVWNSWGLGCVGQLFWCLVCVTTRELNLETLIYLRFQRFRTLTKPPDMFSRSTHIQTHTFARRHSENSPQIRDALQAPFLLEHSTSVYPEFTSLNGRVSPQTKTRLAQAAPRGCAIWPPYMDMYFQIWGENPKSDLWSEPKNPLKSQSTVIRLSAQ